MTVKRVVAPRRWIGVAGDTMPTVALNNPVPEGSTFYARDTGVLYITYDGTNWVEKLDPSPGVAATSLGKAEDAAHTSGDTGVMTLGVRRDTPSTLAGTDGDYVPFQFDNKGNARVVNHELFGEPTLFFGGSGAAKWDRYATAAQKGTGWQAKLTGGAQSGDDFGALYIPVNEMPVIDLDDAGWSWYQTNAEVYGVNIVIWTHDPDDFDKRAEITQSGSATSLDKGSGWNSHEFPGTAAEFFQYGENTTGTTMLTPLYTWAQFQADALFSTWTIYRISLDYGWYSTGTFEDVWITELQVNGEQIPIRPGVTEVLHNKPDEVREIRVAIASTGTSHGANDVININNCTTTSVAIQFANVVRNNGGYGRIIGASIIDETENVSPRIQVQLYTAEPTCANEDEATNTGPIKADRSTWIGNIDFPALNAVSASIASYAQVSTSTVGNLPLTFKCGAASTTLYSIWVAVDAFTHETTEDIEVTLEVEQIVG